MYLNDVQEEDGGKTNVMKVIVIIFIITII